MKVNSNTMYMPEISLWFVNYFLNNDNDNIYSEFDIWFTNKAHVIIDLVPQAMARTGRSLYLSSEQVVEATHAQFDKFWKNFKVRDLERESHEKRLLKCVVFFNSKNL